MIRAVLSNPSHQEYGVATIPFPIPHDQYARCMELLEALEIGDAVKADCKVQAIDSFYTVLKRTEMLTVNVEELNYLAKRLESFDTGEAAQFQAMAHKLELFKLKDFINLTFCCQQATVITSSSDLAAIGRDHYMNLHGGSARVDELEALDGEETARRLIGNGNGTITPYGVAYDNGMKLEQVYDGQLFPCYYYEPNAITVAVTAKSEPEDTERITWLFLPMAQEEIDRALQRAGITDPADVRLRLENTQLPNEVDVLLDMEQESLADLNALAQAADALSSDDIKKLGAIRMLENSESADPVIAQMLRDLSRALEQVDGKHVYGYLPKEVKAQVDEVVERLAQFPEVAACYEQWWQLKEEIAGYYGRNIPPHQPLVQQKEFRTIKNFIISEAETICELTPLQTSTDAEQNEPQEPLDETPTTVPPQTAPLKNAITADAVMQLLLHMSRMFRGNMPVIPPVLRIDSKRRRRLMEKRMAMGHKRDDHEDEQLHHVNDNTMQ